MEEVQDVELQLMHATDIPLGDTSMYKLVCLQVRYSKLSCALYMHMRVAHVYRYTTTPKLMAAPYAWHMHGTGTCVLLTHVPVLQHDDAASLSMEGVSLSAAGVAGEGGLLTGKVTCSEALLKPGWHAVSLQYASQLGQARHHLRMSLHDPVLVEERYPGRFIVHYENAGANSSLSGLDPVTFFPPPRRPGPLSVCFLSSLFIQVFAVFYKS